MEKTTTRPLFLLIFFWVREQQTNTFPARLTSLHPPEDFSSFRILSSQHILSGGAFYLEGLPHLILIPSALRNYSIMGHQSPGTIHFLQMLRQYFLQFGRFFLSEIIRGWYKRKCLQIQFGKRSRITVPIVGILWHRGI